MFKHIFKHFFYARAQKIDGNKRDQSNASARKLCSQPHNRIQKRNPELHLYRKPRTHKTRHDFHQWVVNWRLASFLATAITTPILGVTTLFYLTKRPPPPPKPIEKLIAPHKEIIAETTQKPPETTTTINMASIEDLAKISEALIKPILYTKEEKTHTFYIIENNTKYQYKTTASTKT